MKSLRLTFLVAALACTTARSGHAGLSAFTQLCWAAPHTVSSDDNINPAAFADCTSTGSANVTTPSAAGDQIFSGAAFAQADDGVWKVSYDVAVSNYMRNMYQYSSTTSTDFTTPTTAYAQASLSDTITVDAAGGTGVYSLSFIFSVDGTLNSTDQALFTANFCTSLFLPEGTGTATSFCRNPGDVVPSTFTLSYADLPFGGPVDPTISISAIGNIAALRPDQVGGPNDTILNGEMHVNFGSTIHLQELLVTDSHGDPVPGVTISSRGGFTFPLAAVNQTPEPGWLVLPGLTALALLARRRRNRA